MDNIEIRNKPEKQSSSFREFIEKSTNLMTVFAILNALFIYSTTIDDTNVKLFLVPSFFLLSLLIWFEIILFTLDNSDNSFRYQTFYFLSAIVELGLIWYFVVKFYFILIAVGFVGAFFGLAYILILLLIWLLPKWILRLIKNEKINKKTVTSIVVLLAIVISMVITKICLVMLFKMSS